jgi:hypothetical protein
MATKRYKVLIVEEDAVEFGEYIELDLNGINIFFDGGAEFTADSLTDGIIEAKAEATGKARFIKTLTRNNQVNNNEYFGVTENISGLDSPIKFPRNCILEEVQFQNNRVTDFNLLFRKGSPTATPFLTISETGVDSASETGIEEAFTSGQEIYIQYVRPAGNPARIRDVYIDLYVRNQ